MTKLEIIAFYTQWFIDNNNRLIELIELEDSASNLEIESLELTNDLIRGFVDKLSIMVPDEPKDAQNGAEEVKNES